MITVLAVLSGDAEPDGMQSQHNSGRIAKTTSGGDGFMEGTVWP